MTHLATADSDLDFARRQVDRFRAATAAVRAPDAPRGEQRRRARLPEARFDAARCGIALYGLSPFGTDPAADGLEPALRWESYLAQVKLLRPGRAPATAARTWRPPRGSASSRSATRTASAAT